MERLVGAILSVVGFLGAVSLVDKNTQRRKRQRRIQRLRESKELSMTALSQKNPVEPIYVLTALAFSLFGIASMFKSSGTHRLLIKDEISEDHQHSLEATEPEVVENIPKEVSEENKSTQGVEVEGDLKSPKPTIGDPFEEFHDAVEDIPSETPEFYPPAQKNEVPAGSRPRGGPKEWNAFSSAEEKIESFLLWNEKANISSIVKITLETLGSLNDKHEGQVQVQKALMEAEEASSQPVFSATEAKAQIASILESSSEDEASEDGDPNHTEETNDPLLVQAEKTLGRMSELHNGLMQSRQAFLHDYRRVSGRAVESFDAEDAQEPSFSFHA